MAIYEGELHLLGTSRNEGERLGSVYSVVEIGEKELRNVQVSDYLGSFLSNALGKNVELLVSYGNSPSRKRVLAVRVDGRVRKDNFGLYYSASAICVFVTLLSLAAGWYIITAIFGLLALLSLKMVADLVRFK